MNDDEIHTGPSASWEDVARVRQEVIDRLRAELAVVRAHDRDGERWRQLVKLATQWPQTVLVVNINIGHDWHTADTPKQIQDVVDAAMRAEG